MIHAFHICIRLRICHRTGWSLCSLRIQYIPFHIRHSCAFCHHKTWTPLCSLRNACHIPCCIPCFVHTCHVIHAFHICIRLDRIRMLVTVPHMGVFPCILGRYCLGA